MAGNMSTGMRAVLLAPSTTIIKQTTIIRYGVRIAKRDIGRAFKFSREVRRDPALMKAGLNFFAGLKSGMTSYDDSVARLNSRHNLNELRILNSGSDGAS